MADPIFFDDVTIGDQMPVFVKSPVDIVQLVKYAGASGDFNPIHYDPDVGKASGIGGVIAHGMLVMGFVGQAVTNWIPQKYLRKFGVRFAGMTRPGDVVTITGTVRGKRIPCRILCDVEARNQNGVLLVSGSFEAELPAKK